MKKFFSLFLALTICFTVALCAFKANASGSEFQIYGIYLEQPGDCTLLNSGGKWLLIDAGKPEDANMLITKIKSITGKTKPTISFMVTHLHNDHYGDYKKIFDAFNMDKLYIADYKTIGNEYNGAETMYNKIVNAFDSKENTETLHVNSKFTFGGLSATVIGPVGTDSIHPNSSGADNDNDNGEYSNSKYGSYLNNCSLVTKFTAEDGFSYLNCGDIEKEEENALLYKYSNEKGGTLDCDVFKLNHHGITTSNQDKFIDALSPTYSYALNTGYTTYTSALSAARYGVVYLVGYEKKDFKFIHKSKTKNEIYKGTSATANKLSGVVSMQGPRTLARKNTECKTNWCLNKDSGMPEKGIIKNDSGKYFCFLNYLCENGSYNSNGEYNCWKNYTDKSGKSFYRAFKENNEMYVGFNKIGGKTYYFSPETGYRLLGLQKIKGKQYYFIEKNNAAYMYTAGWKTFDVTSGGKTVKKYRYFGLDGVMKTGWFTVDGKKYYFDTDSGFRVQGLKKISGKTYYFTETNSACYAYTGGWKKFGKNYKYFGADGVMKTGWFTLKGKKYFLNPANGNRMIGLKKISGKTYYFTEKNSAAYMYNKGWKNFNTKYRYFNKKGVMATGWKKIGGKKYYFNTSTGFRTVGKKKIKGKIYRFDQYGVLKK